MTFIDSLGCRLYEGTADGWRSSWDTHMRRRDALWDGRRWGVVDNFHVKLDLYRKALRTYVFLYLGAQWSEKSKKPAEISSLTKITSDV